MTSRTSRILVAVWIVTAMAVDAGEQKCHGSARECDQKIREFMSGRRFLGATIEERDPGLVIVTVTPGGPAQRAGLVAGDRLIACNSKALTRATAREFKQILAEARETGRLSLIVWRRGSYRKIDARLEPYGKDQIDKIISAHLSQSHPSAAGAQR